MSKERIEDARKALDGLQDAAACLADKSKAAMCLGMDNLADMLYHLAEQINFHGEALHKCWSDEFYKRCDDAEVATGQMLVAALAVCDLKALARGG